MDKWLLQVGISGNMWNSMQTVMDLLWIYQTSVMFSKQLQTMNWSLNTKQSFLRQPSVLTTMQPWQLMKSQHLKLIQLSGTIMSWNSGYLVIQLWQFRKSGLVTKNLTVKISLFNCMLTAKPWKGWHKLLQKLLVGKQNLLNYQVSKTVRRLSTQ